MPSVWNVQKKIIVTIIRANETITKSIAKCLSNVKEIIKPRNYRKQPYWALQIYFGKY
jgi:hypothetical protein